MKKTLLLFAMMLFGLSAMAKPVDQATAARVATNFWNAHREAGVKQLATTMSPLVYEDFDAFYVFTPADAAGFVIVAADDRVMPVLAYSFSNYFSTENENARYWLGQYQEQIAQWRNNEAVASVEVTAQWKAYASSPESDTPQPLTAVAPLVTTQWSQSPYYNDLCPYDAQYQQRAVTGCAATAMAQVMKYWSFPTHGWGSYSYVEDDYGTLSANFGATTYAWSNMPTQLTAASSTVQRNAVATLMYHCGVAIEMDYGVGGSSAYLSRWDINYPSVESALIRYFGYNENLHDEDRDVYSDAQWKAMIKAEIDANRPVLYRGQDTSGGHAFICDGYNAAETQFHFNWGWDGYCDGYYSLSNLAPSTGGTGGNTSGTYNMYQSILVGVMPGNGPAVDVNSCAIIRFPYTMNFDGLRDCWSIYDANGDGQTWDYDMFSGRGVNGSSCAAIWYAEEADDYLISPYITVADSFTVSWQVKVYSASWPETYQVYAGNTLIFSETLSNTEFVSRQATFAVAPGDTSYLIFRYVSDDEYALFLDDIVINRNSTDTTQTEQYIILVQSADPTMGTVSGGGIYLAGTNVTITATANDGYHFSAWNDGNTNATRTITVTADAMYTAYFEEDASQDCFITSFPYTENFDDTTTYSCLGVLDFNHDGETWGLIDSFGTNYSRAVFIMYAVNADDILSLPGIVTPGTYTVTWKAMAYSGNYPETYQVYAGMENMIFNETLSSTSYVTRTATFTVAAGDTVNVAFRYISNDMYAFFLDDITISQGTAPQPTQYTITVQSADPTMGTVSGGGTYAAGSSVTISATANSGYHFTQWNDGNTSATRTITVTADATYIAGFEADTPNPPVVNDCFITSFPYTENFDDTTTYSCLRLMDNNGDGVMWGLIDSFGTNYSVAAFIMYAVQADDYLILPGITTPGTYTLTWKAMIYNSNYPETYQVYASSNMIFSETLTSTSYVTRTATFTVEAGDTVNVMFRYISDDMYAFFLDDITISQSAAPGPTQYTITVQSANPTMGTVSGGGTYNAGTSVTISATANSGYHFTQWNDGNTNATRTIIVNGNATYIASFEADVNPQDPCIVNTFPYLENFENSENLGCWVINDVDGDGFNWLYFSDGSSSYGHSGLAALGSASWDQTAGPLTPDNWLITPGFALPANQQLYLKWYEKGQDVNDFAENYSVYVSTTGDAITDFTTVVYSGTTVNSWQQQSVNLSAYAGQTIYVAFRHHNTTNMYYLLIDDVEISAGAPQPTQYTLTVLSNNDNWGNVTGGGTYPAGSTATIKALPYSGYRFVQWQDGNTNATRNVTVNADATYIATFAQTQGIDDVNAESLTLYPNPATDKVTVVGIEQAEVTVTDIAGRTVLVRTFVDGNNIIDVSSLAPGTYFVRIATDGDTAVRKLIVR